eukprot:CAMPEP_0173144316 /NCGR_PEP_ID=MMETSP1105-20130129/7156_1 /TAXON_ID=2985 /ORGANISM="Ochromonas sp., Strain BG-1" /LENGTH=870 /DNA_ID=CAMNT_0014057965 /DNA_START=70 /DNA_END=2682 /DNA_ORIENTATION=-
MSGRNTVKVCVRTRPTQNFAQDNLFIDTEHASILVKHVEPESAATAVLNNRQNSFKFKFDHVFHNASQSAVYDLHARDTVHDVADGISGAIMTYGQTGSGKTFTMLGDAQSYEHRGVAPRAITQLFHEINSRAELEFQVSVTYMEIYNERIYDLLIDLSRPEQSSGEYTIVEEKDGRGIFVRGLTEIEVRDETSALNLLFTGGLSRTTATHKLNKRSNRSHSIFTLYVQQRQRSGVSEKITHSKLHLVDLAGSERLKKTMDSMDGSMGDEITRKESMAINRSLTYLEQCVVALTRKSSGSSSVGANHIPYRQSKLTNILKDCLGANCNTLMIACIWGESSHLEETISTLRLASRMMKVQNESVSIESVDPTILLKKQENIIKALKQELLMHDALVERTGMIYEPYTPEQQQEISQLIEKYVTTSEKDEENVLSIQSYRQMLEICKQFKKKLIEARRNGGGNNSGIDGSTANLRGSSRGGVGTGGISFDSSTDFKNADAKTGGGSGTSGYDKSTMKEVGTIATNGRGFALGEAKIDSRPPNGIETSNFYAASPKFASGGFGGGGSVGGGVGGSGGPGGGVNGGNFSPIPSNRNFGNEQKDWSPLQRANTNNQGGGLMLAANDIQSFEYYIKSSPAGQQLFQQFIQLKTSIKEAKNKIRSLTSDVNDTKYSIDELNVQLENQKFSRIQISGKGGGAKGTGGKSDIVDEEEIRLAKLLKEKKQFYRNSFEQLQKNQFTANAMNQEINEVKGKMMDQFKTWQMSNNGKTGGGGGAGISSTALQELWESNSAPVDDKFASSLGAGTGGFDPLNATGNNQQDELDDQEAFDKLETERVLANDPDSLAFFMAQKTRKANLTQSGGAIRMLQKNKRFN